MYWFVSFPSGPTDDEKAQRWNDLLSKTQSLVNSSPSRLRIPTLKVGTLDSLFALSDDMAKFNALIESTVIKLRRQFLELSRLEGGSSSSNGLTIEGKSIKDYLASFTWEEAKYPTNRPLKETVEKIQETVGKIEDDLKVKTGEYNQVKGALTAIMRKSAGTLAVKDLSGIVKAEHIVQSEYLTTLIVVIPKFNIKEWKNTYEKLNEYVVPRSTQVIAEDMEFALVSVVIFVKEVENFRKEAKTKGFLVRDFTFEADQSEEMKENLEATKTEVNNKQRVLEECAWIHMLVIRLFVESILRYGLPPSFVAGVIETKPSIERKLRNTLQQFGDDLWTSLDETGPTGGALGPSIESETLPYVCYTINPEL